MLFVLFILFPWFGPATRSDHEGRHSKSDQHYQRESSTVTA